MFYSLVNDQNGTTLSLIFSDGDTKSINSEHPNYSKILAEVTGNPDASEKEILEQLDLINSVGSRLRSLSERVAVVGNTILFDGDPIQSEITGHIVRLIAEEDEHGWKALVNFLEKVQTNPEQHSRDSLFSWINGRNITITPEGDFIAYKGVQTGSNGYESINSGTATVNGVVHKGHIPNHEGAVIEMPRSTVEHDTAVGCSTGLHAGTWKYAHDFARSAVLVVRINPRDVVSVPTDCNAQKLRVSRYVVLNVIENEFSGTTYTSAQAEDEYWDDEDEYYEEEYDYDEDDLD